MMNQLGDVPFKLMKDLPKVLIIAHIWNYVHILHDTGNCSFTDAILPQYSVLSRRHSQWKDSIF